MNKIRIDGVICNHFKNEVALKKSGFHGFIYVTKCLTNNKFYVGKSKFNKRADWQTYLGSGYDLKADVRKFGKENFKRAIIDVALDSSQLSQLETNYIAQFNAIVKENWYNSPRRRRRSGLKPFEEIKQDW
jgi:hypothetical protein